MNVKEKLYFLKFLYDSSDNANVLDYVFQETLLQDKDVLALRKSLEDDYFFGTKGQALHKIGVNIYKEIMSSPKTLDSLQDRVNAYLEQKHMEQLSASRITEKLILDVEDYSVVDSKEKKVLEQYFIDSYKAMLYTAIVFGGQKGLANIQRFEGNDLYNWLLYFQDNMPHIEDSSTNTWVIYWHNYSGYQYASNLSCYEVVYYKGQEKFHSLAREKGAIQYTPWIWGSISDVEQANRKILCFGIGNITNIEINGVERIFDRNIIFDLPLKGELYEKGLGSNPVKTISRFLGDKGELFCISPLQYVSICNATSHNYARRVQRGSAPVCPICNAILQSGQKICPRHCNRV